MGKKILSVAFVFTLVVILLAASCEDARADEFKRFNVSITYQDQPFSGDVKVEDLSFSFRGGASLSQLVLDELLIPCLRPRGGFIAVNRLASPGQAASAVPYELGCRVGFTQTYRASGAATDLLERLRIGVSVELFPTRLIPRLSVRAGFKQGEVRTVTIDDYWDLGAITFLSHDWAEDGWNGYYAEFSTVEFREQTRVRMSHKAFNADVGYIVPSNISLRFALGAEVTLMRDETTGVWEWRQYTTPVGIVNDDTLQSEERTPWRISSSAIRPYLGASGSVRPFKNVPILVGAEVRLYGTTYDKQLEIESARHEDVFLPRTLGRYSIHWSLTYQP